MTYYKAGTYYNDGVTLNIAAPSFRFGAGVFETILFNGKNLCFFNQHLDRMESSLEKLGFVVPQLDYAEIAMNVVDRCGLSNQFARVNIFALIDENDMVDPIIAAAPYTPQPDKRYRVCTVTDGVQHPLLSHKTMNYMYNWLQRRSAIQKGYDDAVLLSRDNLITETTTAALLFGDGERFCLPGGKMRLPSIALEAARSILPIYECSVRSYSVGNFRYAYMLNSLIGMRPVTAINGTMFMPDEHGCKAVTEKICGC
ncbi:aminotransferase class IV [Halodesulfovibrio aestuarii]|uniref:aminotransferase class IV n=1 Tax=Halodesulfovibrio aestuarii TaxID=126333 RepID=UPI0003FA9E38